MADKEVQRLLEEVREWSADGYGRKSLLAREVKVPQQTLSGWLKGRGEPTATAYLRIRRFLRGR